MSERPESTLPASSKTQRKREATALRKLGESLLELPAAQLAAIDLPESLREALAAAARISAHGGRRRQLRYIGKLMRAIDPRPLQQAIDRLRLPSRRSVALMHRCEQLRDRLLADDAALTELLAQWPDADVQQLRAMIRAARCEHDRGAPPKQARALYRRLHERLLAGEPT